MEIKTIQFEKQDFDEGKYKIAGDFQKRFLGNHSALHLPPQILKKSDRAGEA